MAVASTVFVKKMLLYASQFATLFRVNTGTGWVGDKVIKLENGDVLIKNARPFKAGLHVGGGDIFGWKSELVTQEWCARMMGKKIARVVNLECKYGTGRLMPDQRKFINQVNDAGGIAGEVRSEDDVARLLSVS